MSGLGVKGNYLMQLQFGDTIIDVDPSTIAEFTIVQDINKYLPTVRINIADSSGTLTHTTPFDKNMNRVHIEIGRDISEAPQNSFDVVVFRRFPISQFGAAVTYDVVGLLNTADALFGPDYCRGWKDKTIKEIMEYIATEELLCDVTDVSPSLDYKKVVVQPHWNNAQLLNDLTGRLIGKNDESAFKCFIRRKNRKTEFVCRSLGELVATQQPVAKFIINDEPFEDYLPVYEYEIFDNYKIFGIMGSKRQEYGYYDYYNSRWINASEQAESLLSLSEYFMIDGSDGLFSDTITELGRNHEFTRDHRGAVRRVYHDRLMGLVKMWILVWGNATIMPGDLVQILFGQGVDSGNIATYQYSGYWLVERVVNMFGDTFRTKLLLTRNGLDTDVDTSLLKAPRRKK